MFRALQCLFVILFITGLVGSFQVYAQETDPEQAELQLYAQESAKVAIRDAAYRAQAAADTANQTDEVAMKMTGTQDFILKLTAVVMPLLIAMMTGIMLYIQIKQKGASEVRSAEQREDLILVARSINGVKTELVAKAELAAYLEGMQTEAKGTIYPNTDPRLCELREAARSASEKAGSVASETVTQLTQKHQAPIAVSKAS